MVPIVQDGPVVEDVPQVIISLNSGSKPARSFRLSESRRERGVRRMAGTAGACSGSDAVDDAWTQFRIRGFFCVAGGAG